jgi:hypothetical protein
LHNNRYSRRDLTVIPITEDKYLVITCDSCGSIGLKDGDTLKLPPYYTAKFTARVALTEIICSGAKPVTLINGAACEMNPTGKEFISGIQNELKNAGIKNIILTGSTEENFKTNMTALAVTVIGTASKNELKFGQAEDGDKLVLFGLPHFGTEVDLESKGFYELINQLLLMPNIREIVPVGSKGIAYEAETLAAINGKKIKLYETDVDYQKSAGPATCLLVLCEEEIQKGTIIGEIV